MGETKRWAITTTASALAVALAVACGGGGSDGTGNGGSGNASGSAGDGSGGAPGTGSAPGSGGGGTVPPPTQDPNTGQWLCGSPDGTMHVCQCNDGLDNDGDQTIDRLDPNCAGTPNSDVEQGSTSGGNCGTTQCSNCVDDDGDGTVDSADAECTGAIDNDEGSFATGIPGDNVDACKQDCFFDGNSGAGDDGCNWELKCDPANPGSEVGCPYDADYQNCPEAQSQKCIDNCSRYTPNGCDCFGCCSVFVDGEEHNVKLLGSCSVENIDDPEACPVCTKEPSCNNTCERCEYCLGKEPPADCFPSNPPPPGDGGVVSDGGTSSDGGAPPPPAEGQCSEGQTPCVPGAGDCPASYYCLTGCCVASIE